jgi:hypothetical protein
MSRADRSKAFSSAGKSLGVAAVLALVWWTGVAPVHAQTCLNAENINIFYWSSPAHTQLVGTCSTGPCPGAGCTGSKSSYTSSNVHLCVICE